MDCPHCKRSTPGIIDENRVWCNRCGTSIRQQFEFVPDYNNPHSAPRQQLYSRVRRFTKYIQKMCKGKAEVLESVGRILDIYSTYEFVWCCHKDLSRRIYFFAKPVMLQACCEVLDIKAELPSLKDKNREIDQHRDLKKLRDSVAWRTVRAGC